MDRGVPHERNAAYPGTRHLADWSIGNGKIFMEYFGLAEDSPEYDRTAGIKRGMCRANKIILIGIHPRDIYPHVILEKKMSMFYKRLTSVGRD